MHLRIIMNKKKEMTIEQPVGLNPARCSIVISPFFLKPRYVELII